MMVVVLETGGNLGPEIFKLLLVLLIVGFISLDPVLHILIVCTCIMMNIQDAVHTVINHVINDFLYSVHPGFIHGSVCLHVLEPGNWDADRIKTVLLQKIYHRFGGRNLSPCFLEISNRVAVHVHPHGNYICAVAEVGTDAHVLYCIHSTFLYIVCVQVYLVAGNHVLAAQCCLPPVVGWHVASIPRHEEAPFCTGVPCFVNTCGSCIVVGISSALSQCDEFTRIASLNLLELLSLLSCIIAIEVATDDIYILIARIPVCIIVVGIGIAIVVLCSPSPNQVVDSLVLEVIKHGLPKLFVSFSTIISPPEPGLAPAGTRFQTGIAGCLVEWSPNGNNACILQLLQNFHHLVHLLIEPFVLPSACRQYVGCLKGGFGWGAGHTATICSRSGVFCLRHVEVPHQRYQSALVCPVGNRGDVVVVDPAVGTLLRNIDMDKIIAVHGRIFAGCPIDLICFLCVPVNVGDDRRDGLAAIIQLQIFVETFGLFCSRRVCKIHIAYFAFVIDREGDVVDVVDVVGFESTIVFQTRHHESHFTICRVCDFRNWSLSVCCQIPDL